MLVPVTQLTISPALPEGFVSKDTQTQLIIHYNLHDIGRLTRPAKHILTPDDLVTGAEIPLEGIYAPPPPGFEPNQLILQDANGVGVLVDGTINFDKKGGATMTVTGGTWDSETMLRVPVTVHGNVLPVSVGETVRDELLGDGDPSIAYQSFELKKAPLTYLNAPGSERGYASTLEVRVGGVRWAERPTFYGAGPTDRIFTVRHDEDGATTITFGDGIRGARLPAGSGNVRATYRFGAGATSIPAGSITQIVRGAPGLVRVRSPAPLNMSMIPRRIEYVAMVLIGLINPTRTSTAITPCPARWTMIREPITKSCGAKASVTPASTPSALAAWGPGKFTRTPASPTR